MAAELTAREQIEVLYADHHGWLKGWLRRRLGDPGAAADMAHDTFLRLITARDMLAGLREPRAFLTTVARRLLVDGARRRAIEQAYLEQLALSAGSGLLQPSPEEIMQAVETLEQISAALHGVPPRPRAAFLRHYLDGQPHAVIAAELGVSTRMVRKYLVQALMSCRANCPAVAIP